VKQKKVNLLRTERTKTKQNKNKNKNKNGLDYIQEKAGTGNFIIVGTNRRSRGF